MLGKSKEDFVQYWKEVLSTEIDTYMLQVESLREFLDALGYEIDCNTKDGTWHIHRNKDNCIPSCPEFLSLDTAVSLHNGTLLRGFDDSLHKKAGENKLVGTVYLQRVKGEWKSQRNMVKFVK